MSGPKKADVKAALNIARQAQRRGSELLGAGHRSSLQRGMRRAEQRCASANKQRTGIERALNVIDPDVLRLAAPSVQAAMDASRAAATMLEQSESLLREAISQEQAASKGEAHAKRTYDEAEREYQRASRAISTAGGHYLHREMEWAQQARALFDEAARQLGESKSMLQSAQRAASEAEMLGSRAAHALDDAEASLARAKLQSTQQLEVEREAKRIAEEQLRTATLRVEAARAEVNQLLALPIERFAPGEKDRLAGALRKADQLLEQRKAARADDLAKRLATETTRVRQHIVDAQRRHEEAAASAQVATSTLDSAVADAERSELAPWLNPNALRAVTDQHLRPAQVALENDAPNDAALHAARGQAALTAALEAAAERLSAHEQRDRIGEAVMEVLDEMGFDVSFEPGDSLNPMRISGMTPDENGRGDFDIEIPLDGELDFEVTAHAGDNSCVSAIGTLTERLATMGIDWTTTNWGHASSRPTSSRKETTKVGKEQTKVKGKY